MRTQYKLLAFLFLSLVVMVFYSHIKIKDAKAEIAPAVTTPSPTSCTNISGLVMEYSGALPTPAACPPNGAVGINNVTVRMNNGQGEVTKVTSSTACIGPSPCINTVGVFNIDVRAYPPGVYNFCADVPAGDFHYCNINNKVDGYVYSSQCAKIDTRDLTTCAGNRLVFSKQTPPPLLTNTPVPPSPTSIPVPTRMAGTSEVSGQVFSVGTQTPAQCSNEPAQISPSPFPGVNNVSVNLTLKCGKGCEPLTHTVTTAHDIVNGAAADGIFRFYNMEPGTYDLCMDTRQDFYCVNTSPDTFNTQVCKTITVSGTSDSSGHRFAVKGGSCPRKVEGDANCDNAVDMTDYFYLERKIAGAALPAGVDPDFNGDHAYDTKDRDIVIHTIYTGFHPANQ